MNDESNQWMQDKERERERERDDVKILHTKIVCLLIRHLLIMTQNLTQ